MKIPASSRGACARSYIAAACVLAIAALETATAREPTAEVPPPDSPIWRQDAEREASQMQAAFDLAKEGRMEEAWAAISGVERDRLAWRAYSVAGWLRNASYGPSADAFARQALAQSGGSRADALETRAARDVRYWRTMLAFDILGDEQVASDWLASAILEDNEPERVDQLRQRLAQTGRLVESGKKEGADQ